MQSRRGFMKSFLGTAATLVLADKFVHASAQKAALTTAQFRESGTDAKLMIHPLRNSVSMVYGSGGNVLVLPGPEGKLVVDSGLATSRVQMAKALDSVSAEPLRFLVNTHWHFDHTDGNEWMNGAGATIFAQEKTLSRMTHKQFIPEFEGVYPPSPAGALPTQTFGQSKTLEVNGQTLHLVRYTPAHTDTDTAVYFVNADVLHTGDSWFSAFYPFIDYNSGGSIDGMLAATRETLALTGRSTIIVCGHGPAGNREDVVVFQEMLANVRSNVAKLKQSGASADEVIARKPTAAFDKKWGGGFISPDLFTWLVYRGT